MPVVSRLTVTPVKGLAVHHPEEIRLNRDGVPGNRQFVLLDSKARLFSGVRHGRLVTVHAEYDAAGERLALRFPDGAIVEDAIRLGEAVEAKFWGRRVATHAVLGPFGEALSHFVGRELRFVRVDVEGGGWDEHVVSLLSEASLEQLARRSGYEGPVDGRRFRMVVQMSGGVPHEEDGWIGRRVRIGGAVVRVAVECARCATTMQNPESGETDFDALRAIAGYRELREGRHVDFGVYADVDEPGLVRVGDAVELLEEAALPER